MADLYEILVSSGTTNASFNTGLVLFSDQHYNILERFYDDALIPHDAKVAFPDGKKLFAFVGVQRSSPRLYELVVERANLDLGGLTFQISDTRQKQDQSGVGFAVAGRPLMIIGVGRDVNAIKVIYTPSEDRVSRYNGERFEFNGLL